MRFSNIIGNGNFVAFDFASVTVHYTVRLDQLTKHTKNKLLRAIEHGYASGRRGAEATVYSLLTSTQGLPPTFCGTGSSTYLDAIVATAYAGDQLEEAMEQAKAMLAMATNSRPESYSSYSRFGVEKAHAHWLEWRSTWDHTMMGNYSMLRLFGNDINLATARAVLAVTGVVEFRNKFAIEFGRLDEAVRKGRRVIYQCKLDGAVPNSQEVIACYLD